VCNCGARLNVVLVEGRHAETVSRIHAWLIRQAFITNLSSIAASSPAPVTPSISKTGSHFPSRVQIIPSRHQILHKFNRKIRITREAGPSLLEVMKEERDKQKWPEWMKE
jgi:hypothetical protein